MTRRNFIDTEVALAYGQHSDVQEAAAEGTWFEDRQFIDQFIDLLPPKGLVLDVGAGSGNQAQYFVERRLSVAMSEGSAEMLEVAQRHVPSACGRVGMLPIVPFPERQFDGVFSRHVLHHLALPNVETALKNMHKVIKSVGHLALVVAVSPTAEVQQGWWAISDEDHVQINRYPRSIYRDILANVGFACVADEVVAEEGVPILRTIVRKGK